MLIFFGNMLLPHVHRLPSLLLSEAPSLAGSAKITLEDKLEAAEVAEAELVQALANSISIFRQKVFDANPFQQIEFPTSEYILADYIGEVRYILVALMQQERILSVLLLASAIFLAVVGSLAVGDRTSPAGRQEATDTTLRKSLSPSAAAAFDAGRDAQYVESLQQRQQQQTQDKVVRREKKPVSTGLWLELLLCILIDSAGDASLFYPAGEFIDLGYAFLSALLVELLFDWPLLALVALWEELLPLTDLLPTATIGWLLVVVLGLRPAKRTTPSLLRGPVDTNIFAAGTRPPVTDRRSYQPPESWLRPGSSPWED